MATLAITKEGSVLKILTSERDKPFTLDYLTREIRSYTGRIISTFPNLLRPFYNGTWGYETGSTFNKLVLRTLHDYMSYDTYWRSNHFDMMLKLEKFLSYSDLIETSYINDLPNDMPKGYTKWLRENGKKISKRTLKEFQEYESAKTWTADQREIYETFKPYLNYNYQQFICDMTPEQRIPLLKVLKASMKHFYFNFTVELSDFMSYLYDSDNYRTEKARPDDWYKYLNTERDILWNKECLRCIANKERNEKITEWQKLFKSIEQMENDNYKIVVPTEMYEFTAEGRQQNNCVSYYYHNSMSAHHDIIYFIRRKSNVKHSYITCRFHVGANCTAEKRIVNNDSVEDSKALEFIEIIDEKLNEIIKEISEKSE